jgi:spore coat polysaccharide biosynthesis predicted glycosyltransferase SpsG
MEKRATPRVLVVCRGSSEHGLGHVMRARTVASCLARRLPVDVLAIGDAAVLEPLLRNRGLTFWIELNAAAALPLARRLNPQVVVFDTTEFPLHDFLDLKRETMTVSLSPAFNCQSHVDLLFHRTCHPTPDLVGLGPGVELRKGLGYVVLRETCQKIPEETYVRNLNRGPLAVAISMGGVDATNHTLQLLASISQLPAPLLLWVLLGEGYAHSYQALVDCVNRDTRHEIILAKTTDSLWRVMETCSLAILAGGVTTYESAFACLPSINVLRNEIGPPLVRELVERGVALPAGPPFPAALPQINADLARLEQSRDELLTMHRRAHGLIDGHGAERIAGEIEQFFHAVYRPHSNPKAA